MHCPDGNGPIVVIQEWWGLVPHIKDVCERFAREGFVALAPDLYHGETAAEPDEAQKMMMALELGRAARDMSGAVSFLRERLRGQGTSAELHVYAADHAFFNPENADGHDPEASELSWGRTVAFFREHLS